MAFLAIPFFARVAYNMLDPELAPMLIFEALQFLSLKDISFTFVYINGCYFSFIALAFEDAGNELVSKRDARESG